MTLKQEQEKRKRKRLVAKAKSKAEAEAKAKRLRAQGKRVEVRRDPDTGLYFIYEILFLAVGLTLLGAIFRPPPT